MSPTLPIFAFVASITAPSFALLYFFAERNAAKLLRENQHLYDELTEETRKRKLAEVELMKARGQLAQDRIASKVSSITRKLP